MSDIIIFVIFNSDMVQHKQKVLIKM